MDNICNIIYKQFNQVSVHYDNTSFLHNVLQSQPTSRTLMSFCLLSIITFVSRFVQINLATAYIIGTYQIVYFQSFYVYFLHLGELDDKIFVSILINNSLLCCKK